MIYEVGRPKTQNSWMRRRPTPVPARLPTLFGFLKKAIMKGASLATNLINMAIRPLPGNPQTWLRARVNPAGSR